MIGTADCIGCNLTSIVDNRYSAMIFSSPGQSTQETTADYLFVRNSPVNKLDHLGLVELKNCEDLPGCETPEGIRKCFPCNEGDVMGQKQNPEYPNQSNGCGPFSDLLGVISGWWIPDSPPGLPEVSFTSPCDFHDCCYGWCSAQRPWCDHMFYIKMIQQCEAIYSGWFFAEKLGQCYGWAQIYKNAVVQHGQDAFDAAQKEACIDCCCPQ